ncbi:MAG: hypothetical protein WBC97_03115 [Gemmatimonadales bacterium]
MRLFEPEQSPPPRDARRWRALVASLVAHAALLVVLAILVRRPGNFPIEATRFITLSPPATAGARMVLPRFGGRHSTWTGRARRGPGTSSRAPTDVPTVLPKPPVEPLASRTAVRRGPADSASATGPGEFGIVVPGLGRARLWVQPLPLEPKQLAQALSSGNVRLVDSAITVIVQHYLDSVATAPDRDRGPPSWTTTVAGTKFGIDAHNIYLAGLKLPTAVLALLKLPGANESRVFDRSYGLMQEDLHRAASRAATMEEFRQSVRELRAERQREHDVDENRKLLPSDSASLRPVSH